VFTIRLVTERYAPAQTVVLRWAPNWTIDRGGVYIDGAWTFDLDEIAFPAGMEFKFVLTPGRWMAGDNINLPPQNCVGVHDFDDSQAVFAPQQTLTTEHGVVPQRFFVRNLDPNHEYDVLVIGSGMGGGLLTSQLADAGADVLLVEAGSYLFPTHVGNLPRRLKIGQFDKQIWSLWPDFQVVNYQNTPGSQFAGAQAFNLGGRSIFWGGLIPRQAEWELGAWPVAVRTYLLDGGYDAAEQALNCVAPPQTAYQTRSRSYLQGSIPGFVAADAPMAVQYEGASAWSVPAGFFSTADLIMEDRLVDDPGARRGPPTVNLNVAVWSVDIDPTNPNRVTGVHGWDMLAQAERAFRAKTVVLAAGTIESAKIALQSQLHDPNNKIGRGITDHTIRYRHFTLPPNSAAASATDSAKVILRHPAATPTQHAFDIVVELGADFNQGRYVDPANLALERSARNNWMLCELVFMSYAELNDTNRVTISGNPADPVVITVNPSPPSPADIAEADQVSAALFATLGAEPLLGENGLALQDAALGGVAHEVGTLRMAGDNSGVVDTDLKFLDYDNVYACDNSVFPTSPAANPSLTLAALALRLAAHLAV
jgi:choline dehydrogenase-like flavoprotein